MLFSTRKILFLPFLSNKSINILLLFLSVCSNTRKQNNAPEEREVNACIENGFIFSAAQTDGTSTVKGEGIEKYGPC